MSYKISVSIDIKTRARTGKIISVLHHNGLYPEAGEISRVGGFSHVNIRSVDFSHSKEGINTLIQSLMGLDPEPGLGPNLVFMDDLEMKIWGYRVSKDQAIAYEASFKRNNKLKP